MKKSAEVTEFINKYPPEVKKIMLKVRAVIQKAAPKAEERISYGVPAYFLNGPLVYFSAFKKHIGFYPASSGIRVFKKELSDYKTAPGTVQFPLDKPVPYGLIEKITKFRVKEQQKKKQPRKK